MNNVNMYQNTVMNKSNWSANGFGKYVSPDLVSDEYLETEINIMLQGNNLFGDLVYSCIKIKGKNLKKLFAAMQKGENFRPSDFAEEVLAAGRGEPSEEVKKEYNLVDVPKPKSNIKIPSFQPKYYEDE